jgi:hypothetical protein
MMGPADHRKATALGELPGRSRRIQTYGRLLRSQFGETDRVIYGDDVIRHLGPEAGHRVLEVTGTQRVRDLNDAVVYFREPLPAKKSDVSGAA